MVATDVVVYIGDLGPLLAAVSRVLRVGGLLAFTTEDLEAITSYAPGWDDLVRGRRSPAQRRDTDGKGKRERERDEDKHDKEGEGREEQALYRKLPPVASNAAAETVQAARALTAGAESWGGSMELPSRGPSPSRRRHRRSPAPSTPALMGWALQPSGRFAHRKRWVVAVAAQHGFQTLVAETKVGRYEAGKPVHCGLFVMQKLAERGQSPR